MLIEFENKCNEFSCETEVIEKDLSSEILDREFDGIISSMTIHHLEDTAALLSKLYTMLNDGGFVAIADLDSEDGSFHSDNTGVFHYGFDRVILENIAKKIGFKNIRFDLASTISKPHREFTVFLMTAVK
jgi:ubiquinone/menaquinone biosynthesis C-methylase UbiE